VSYMIKFQYNELLLIDIRNSERKLNSDMIFKVYYK
jgi:hypothetical protein